MNPYIDYIMYVSPHLKQFQTSFKSSAIPKNGFSSFSSKEKPKEYQNYRKKEEYVEERVYEVPKEKEVKSLTEYLESRSKQEIVKTISENETFKIITLKPSIKKEANVDSYGKINDFWNDLYQFTTDPAEKVHLQWNHHISKESMVKLLKEQGTIRFNPIEYYRNTIENQEYTMNGIVDKLKLKIIQFQKIK